MIKIKKIEDNDLGGKLNPVSNCEELKKVIGTSIYGCYDTCIYTKGTFFITKDIEDKLIKRNIHLIGILYHQLINMKMNKIQKDFEKEILNGSAMSNPVGLMQELERSENKKCLK